MDLSPLLHQLKHEASKAPEEAGVYLHKDRLQKILYIGKAKNLRKRLLSYFTRFDSLSLKTKSLVSKIHNFEVILTGTESQAFVLENQMIKEHQPPYNILLRDDRTYPYLKLDLQREWPGLSIVRRRTPGKSLFFGPYPNSAQAFQIRELLEEHTLLVKCSPHTLRTIKRPCAYYEMGQCQAPCHKPVSRETYGHEVEEVKRFLSGRTQNLAQRIEKKMHHFAAQENYEAAAHLRDQLFLTRDSFRESVWDFSPHLTLTLWSVKTQGDELLLYLSEVRNGHLIGSQLLFGSDHRLDNTSEAGEALAVALHLLAQHFKKGFPPLLLGVLPESWHFQEPTPKELASLWNTRLLFLRSAGFQNWQKRLKKKDRQALKRLIEFNETNLQTHQKARQSLHQKHLQAHQEAETLFEKSLLFHTVEGYDISTFQGKWTVGAKVFFREGQPDTSHYRRFHIRKTENQRSDFHSLVEVLTRRLASPEPYPDVFLIDGGRPQLDKLRKELQSQLPRETSLLGLAKARGAKQERVVWFSEKEQKYCTRLLEEGSSLFQLLTQVRNEAHRFANHFHQTTRNRSVSSSLLQGLTSRQKARLQTLCPEIHQVRQWSLKELMRQTGISEARLKELQKRLSTGEQP